MYKSLLGTIIASLVFTAFATSAQEEPLTANDFTLDASYVDHVAGYAFNYPSEWTLFPADFNTPGIGQTTTLFSSYGFDSPPETLPDDVIKIDFAPSFQFVDFETVQELAEYNRANSENAGDFLFEEEWLLFGQYPAIREQITNAFGDEIALLYFKFGDHLMTMVGYGDLQHFDMIAHSLRPALTGDIETYTDETMEYQFDYPAEWDLQAAEYEPGFVGQVNRVNGYDENGTLVSWVEIAPIHQFNTFDTLDEYVQADQNQMKSEEMGINLWQQEVMVYGSARAVRVQNETELIGTVALLYFEIEGNAFVAAGYGDLTHFDAIAASVRPA